MEIFDDLEAVRRPPSYFCLTVSGAKEVMHSLSGKTRGMNLRLARIERARPIAPVLVCTAMPLNGWARH